MWVQALGFLASLSAAEVATEAAEAGGGAGGEAGGEGARGVGASGDGDGAGGGGGGGVAGFRAAVVEAVEAVEREGLLQPPLLLQLLSPSDLISLDLVRDYLTRQLQREARLTQARHHHRVAACVHGVAARLQREGCLHASMPVCPLCLTMPHCA